MFSKAHHHWLAQRLSAALLILFYPLLLLWFYQQQPLDYEELIVAFQSLYSVGLIAVSLVTAIYHAVLGLQVIIEDYISNILLRKVTLVGLKGFAFALCLLAVFFLIKIKTLEISL